MIWKSEYADCKSDFRECEKLVNEYMNLLYKRGYEPVFFTMNIYVVRLTVLR